jgi:DNA polymerase V
MLHLWRWSPSINKFLLFSGRVPAGFPTPPDGHAEISLSLDELLVKHPASTFFVRTTGDSMRDVGILDGDVLVVDRAKEPKNSDVVIAVLRGEMTVKRFVRRDGVISLCAENKNYKPIVMKDGEELIIWGVVVGCVRKF